MSADKSQLSEPRPRVVWVDVARCLAMFFIMWLHAGAGPEWLGRPVGGAICLFFVLAGYFMPRAAGECARRAWRLGMAWLVWSLLSFGMCLLVVPGLEWSWAKVFGLGTSAYNVPLWFLRNLTLYQLIIAGLAWVRVLPRYQWLVLVLLVGCSWAAAPSQHEGLRFDWMQAVMLGYCLRCVSLPSLTQWLVRHAVVLGGCVVLLFVQRVYYPELMHAWGISTYACSLPVDSLSYALLYCIAAIAIERFLPRLAGQMAVAGSCMLFIYAAHSPLFAPIYHFHLNGAYNIWAPLVGLPLLTVVAVWLSRRFPRTMTWLCARPMK